MTTNSFDYSNIPQISDLVREQFPAFYLEEGPTFVAFIQAYYEWLQDPENPIGAARTRYKEFDIDTTSTKFLEHYRKKYMWGLPPELLGNQRLLQKHILELYRSKGSQQAVRLLFRLLFNEEIDFYIPSYDIFKLSDNTWIEPHYLEVTNTTNIVKFINKEIVGSTTGAKAIVESYQQRIVNNQISFILFVSNNIGEFLIGEVILTDGVDPLQSPIIKGSVTGVEIIQSNPGFSVGDVVTATNGEFPVQLAITDTYTGSGSLEFEILASGTYYSLDTVITEDPLNTDPGVDAAIKVRSLKNTHPYITVEDMVIDYVGVNLNGLYPFPKLPTSDVNTIVADSLDHQQITVGEINTIEVLNPGKGYENNVLFYPVDPYTSNSGILDANGDFVGQNGLIVGVPQVGTSLVRNAKVIDSGFDNGRYELNQYINADDSLLSLSARPIMGAIGYSTGYYENTKSFLSDDKYLFDGHYYQDFSYVIASSMALDKYIDVLKNLVHPTGNAIYGDIKIKLYNRLEHHPIVTRIKKAELGVSGFGLDFARNAYNNYIFGFKEFVGVIKDHINFIRSSIASYYDANGIIQNVPNDEVRLTYDPITKNSRGVLIETSSTNLLKYSNNLTLSPWNIVYGPCVANAAVAPDGTTSATRIVRTSGLSLAGSGVRQTITKPPTQIKYTYSLYAKADQFNRIRIYVNGASTGVNMYVNVDLLTGAILTTSNAGGFDDVEARVDSINNGWYRISLTGTSDDATTLTCRVYSTDSNATIGNGVSGILVWGAQLEENYYPSSIINTSNEVTQRLVDGLIFDSDPIPQTGSAFIKTKTPISSSEITPLIQFNITSDDSIYCYRDENTNIKALRIIDSASITKIYEIDFGNISNNTDFKLALVWDSTDFYGSINQEPGVESILIYEMPTPTTPVIDIVNKWNSTISTVNIIENKFTITELSEVFYE